MKKIAALKTFIVSFSIILAFSLILSTCTKKNNKQTSNDDAKVSELDKKKKIMIERQLKSRGIKDEKVLKAMEKVPRHFFVADDMKNLAYSDSPLPIGFDQTISQPYVVAFMTEAAQVKENDIVLEIGTGSGYQAAVLSELAKEVYTIEILEGLGKQAKQTLNELNYKNVHVRVGDGYKGWPEKAPFDVILVTAAPDHIPQPLIEQLKIGGKIVMPVGEKNQILKRITKTKNGLSEESLSQIYFVPMTGEAQEKNK
ncbi:MAG: protein-L-isoaspartate(D-aspartate) O-methyltransferase [Pseudomonadota bacterium]